MVGGIVRDHDRALYVARAIGVGLKRGVPEIFREMVLADCECHLRRWWVSRESQRERELHRLSIGLQPLAGEIKYLEIPDSGCLERRIVGNRIGAVQQDHIE